jgi:HPt (histidine-containing phosphotransfer) domain-containing protein
LPIIALTANAVSGTKEMFLSNGFNDFLSKPIDIIKLDAILRRWIPKEKQEKSNKETVNAALAIAPAILAAFRKDGAQKIEELKKCLETGDYSLYATHVHGLKSAAANAGYGELSELAKELEMAGKSGNFAFIKKHNDAFLAALQTCLNGISEILQADKKEPADFETLKNELLKLKGAINAFDLAAIDEAANALQAFEQTEDILQKILIGEHEAAISAIDNLLKEAR